MSDLKEQVEILTQGSKSFSTSVPTSFLEQSETLKINPSNKPKMSDVKVDLDEKTEVSEKSSALIYVWLDLRCLFWGNKWQITWKAGVKADIKLPSPL